MKTLCYLCANIREYNVWDLNNYKPLSYNEKCNACGVIGTKTNITLSYNYYFMSDMHNRNYIYWYEGPLCKECEKQTLYKPRKITFTLDAIPNCERCKSTIL